MEKIQGKGVSGGMVMGRIHLVPKKNTAVSHASAHTYPENEKIIL